MTLAVAALLVVASAQPSAPASAPAWCPRATELALTPPADETSALAAFDEILRILPSEAAPLVQRARDLAGAEGIDRSMTVLSVAIAEACAPRVDNAAASDTVRNRASELMRDDPRFGGVRKGDGLFDRIAHKVWLWFVSLAESEGMRTYAVGVRNIVLTAMAVLGIALTFVLLRRVRARQREHSVDVARARVEAARRKAFAAWRDEAARALSSQDARTALRAGQAALLARVGELDERAVTPARTSREIVARLREREGPARSLVDVVQPPLSTFDLAYFGKDATVDDAERFLAQVDAAEAQLRAPAHGAAR